MYSDKFREKCLRMMLAEPGLDLRAFAEEVGVSRQTLMRWRRDSVPSRMTGEDDVPQKTHHDLKPMEKARLLAEADGLGDDELGAWLRAKGLHRAQLDHWRAAIVEALDPAKARSGRKADRKRIKDLEREVRRKDKALAETAALLVLRKKAQALWGDEDDDTDPS